VARAQKAEKFDALAQAALHHLRAGDHFGHDGRDLRRPEIELLDQQNAVLGTFIATEAPRCRRRAAATAL
jgi:hypothetical protein